MWLPLGVVLYIDFLSACTAGGSLCASLEHLSGAGALLLQLYGLSHPADSRLRDMSILAALLFVVNNWSIGAVGAAGVNLLLAARVYASARLDKVGPASRLGWFCIFSFSTTLAMILPGVTPLALLLSASSLWIGYAYFYQEGAGLRVSLGLNKLLWIANAVTYDSTWQVVLCVLGALASFVGAWRVRERQAPESREHKAASTVVS